MNTFVLDGVYILGWQVWIVQRLIDGSVVDEATLKSEASQVHTAYEERHFVAALERLIFEGRIERTSEGLRKAPAPAPPSAPEPEGAPPA